MSIADKTLQELEGQDWGEPTFNSYVVVNCHRLRRVPLKDFRVEDLRLMIGQSMGLPYLVPLALEVLHENPLADGDFYEGDLLSSTLQVPEEFWDAHLELKEKFEEVKEKASAAIDALGDDAPGVLLELRQRMKS